MFFMILWCPVTDAAADVSIATANYVENRAAVIEARTVSKEELKTFSDQLPQRVVTKTDNQEISGTKTYTSSPIVPTPPLP